MARCCPRSSPATGCSSTRRWPVGRAAARSSCSASPDPGSSRSSASSRAPATGSGSPTAGCAWATTRHGSSATPRTNRSPRPGTGRPSTRAATGRSPSTPSWRARGSGTGPDRGESAGCRRRAGTPSSGTGQPASASAPTIRHMDDLRASLAGFDPSAPLASAPDPWGSLPMPAMREGPPWAMAESIAAQPELAGRIVDRIIADGSAARLADALLDAARAAEPVVVTGCGTSEHAAIAIAEILRDAWREAGFRGPEPVGAQAFELALDPTSGGLVIGISHEGGTTATIDALKAAHAGGARTAVITGSAGSPAGEAAEMVVATVELDRSWCHTIGYVAPIVVAAVVAGIVARSP